MTAGLILSALSLTLQIALIGIYHRALVGQQKRIDELTDRLTYRTDAEYRRVKEAHKPPDRPRRVLIDRWEGRDK